MTANLRHDEWLDTFATCKTETHRTTFAFNLQSKVKERAAETLTGYELRCGQQYLGLIRKLKLIAVRELEDAFH
jgi:hypothetical protein